jgi:hypothetical protein
MSRLFISHSNRNNDKEIEVKNWLAANGWDDVFLDLDVQPGSRTRGRKDQGAALASQLVDHRVKRFF